jgi:hypothetical protein
MGRANSKKTKSTVVEAASGLEGIKKRLGARRAPPQPQHEWLSPQFNSALPTVAETTHTDADADADAEETVAKTNGAIGSVATLSLSRAPQSVADASAAAAAAAAAAAQVAAATRVAAGAGVVALSSPANAAAAPSSLPPPPLASPLKEAMLEVVAESTFLDSLI